MAKALFSTRVAVSVKWYLLSSSSVAKATSVTSLPAFRKDPVKHFNEFKYAHDEPCFFKQLTRYAFLQRFAELQRTPWNGPLAPERLAAPPNQQRAPIFNDYASDTNYRTLGIFAGGGHFRNSALARFTIEAAAPRISVDLGQRGI
jgi:hypothetical protein